MHIWKLEFKCGNYHVYSSYLVSDSVEATTKQLTDLFENNKGKSLSDIKKSFEDHGLDYMIKEAEELCGALKDETVLYNYHHKIVKRYLYMGNPEKFENEEE